MAIDFYALQCAYDEVAAHNIIYTPEISTLFTAECVMEDLVNACVRVARDMLRRRNIILKNISNYDLGCTALDAFNRCATSTDSETLAQFIVMFTIAAKR